MYIPTDLPTPDLSNDIRKSPWCLPRAGLLVSYMPTPEQYLGMARILCPPQSLDVGLYLW